MNLHRQKPRRRLARGRAPFATALALAGMAVLGGCSDDPLPEAGRFVRQDRVETVTLFFVPGSARLTSSDLRQLAALRPGLPPDAVLSLAVSDGLEAARAREVGAVLGRFVLASPAPLLAPPGQAQLSVVGRRVVNTDCLAPGQPLEDRDNWPGDDGSGVKLLPPGCAAATALQGMVVDQEDLLHGRPLAPGAAFPVARAIERYYDRWNPAGADSSAGARSPAGAGSGADPAGPTNVTPPPANAAGSSSAGGADLLQGPLQPVGTATGTSAAPAPTPAQ